MIIKKLIEQLQLLDENAEIYFSSEYELYEPMIQNLYDTEAEEDYYIITK